MLKASVCTSLGLRRCTFGCLFYGGLMKYILDYFSKTEMYLWSVSVLMIVISFCVFDRSNYMTLFASLIGVTSLIFNAKGNPIGQILMVVFSLLYGLISYKIAYYGEMATYIGMTMPMALFALVSWLRHPYKGNKSEVEVNDITKIEICFMCVLTLVVTTIFYFILKYFNTAQVFFSTLSVTTSFIAVYLTFRRSSFYAIAYAANDVILMVLWTMASIKDIRYISVCVCFMAFFVNDIYGFISWQRMKIRQKRV